MIRRATTSLERFSRLGERWGLGQTLFARVELSAMRGDERDVVGALKEAERVLANIGGREDIGQIKIRLALAHARAGDLEAAHRELAAADRIAEAIGSEEQRVYLLLTRSNIARWEGKLDEARAIADAGCRAFQGGWPPFEQFCALLPPARGHVAVEAGELDEAYGWYQRALEAAVRTRTVQSCLARSSCWPRSRWPRGKPTVARSCSARRQRCAGSATRPILTCCAFARPRGPLGGARTWSRH